MSGNPIFAVNGIECSPMPSSFNTYSDAYNDMLGVGFLLADKFSLEADPLGKTITFSSGADDITPFRFDSIIRSYMNLNYFMKESVEG